MSKQDRQGVRTPAQLEQKYRIGEALSGANNSLSNQERQLNQLTQTLAQFMASTNGQIAILSIQLQMITNRLDDASNAIKRWAMGNPVVINDISPLQHTLSVELTSNTVTDFEKVEVIVYGENELEGANTYTPNAEGVVEGILSRFPVTTLKTNTEGVTIQVSYNRDLNKVLAELTALG